MLPLATLYFAASQSAAQDDTITPVFLLLIFVVVPILSIRSYYLLKSMTTIPSKRRLLGAVLGQAILLLPAMGSAKAQGLRLWPIALPSAEQVFVALCFLAVMYVSVRQSWRRKPQRNIEAARLLLPQTYQELGSWIAISFLAGISEEYIYRGVLFQTLFGIGCGTYLSAILSVLAFGSAHLHRGLRNGVGIALFGLVFQLFVFWTGSLSLSMFVHVLYDLMVGIVAVQSLKKLRIQGVPAVS